MLFLVVFIFTSDINNSNQNINSKRSNNLLNLKRNKEHELFMKLCNENLDVYEFSDNIDINLSKLYITTNVHVTDLSTYFYNVIRIFLISRPTLLSEIKFYPLNTRENVFLILAYGKLLNLGLDLMKNNLILELHILSFMIKRLQYREIYIKPYQFDYFLRRGDFKIVVDLSIIKKNSQFQISFLI